ncbi:MAG: cytochrome c-type biogenesis protein [Aquihabitans sp.]
MTSPAASRRKVLWGLLAMVVVGALTFGTLNQGEPSEGARARALEETIRCPQCRSQSVAQSDTPSARGVSTVIRDQIAAGRTDEEIRDFVASSYGREVLLEPSGSGFSGLVWALPVVMIVVAVAGLVYRFGDWRPATTSVTAADRSLVAAALNAQDGGGGSNDGTNDAPEADDSMAADPDADRV